MTERTAVAAAIAVALAACSKSDPNARKAARPVVIDVAAVNARVPEVVKATLAFERRALVIERGAHRVTYTLAAPAGWIQKSAWFAHLRPGGKLAPLPRLEVGSNCDGECVPKPWAAIADRVNFASRARGKVLKDEQVPGQRTMIAEVDGTTGKATEVVVAWWIDGDRRYHTCTASLDDSLREAAPAFEQACQAVAIDGED